MAWLYIAVALALAVWFQLDADVYTTLAAKARASRAPPASPPHSVAWITGASSGIGEAVAYDMCRARAHSTLVLSARRGDVLSEVAAKCAALSGGTVAAHVVPFDVTDHEAMEAAVEAVLGEHAQVDVLYLNAGISQRQVAEDTTVDGVRNLLKVNVESVIMLTTLVLPSMLARGSGHLVATSSVAGKLGAPLSATYSATKWALQGYFDAVRAEVHTRGLRVTTLAVGPTDSPIARLAVGSDTSQAKHQIRADTAKTKMAVERCAELVGAAIDAEVSEAWVAKQPFLTFVTLAQYAPGLYRQVSNKLGHHRVAAFKAGIDINDPKALLGGQ